jgi:hypothetical protein
MRKKNMKKMMKNSSNKETASISRKLKPKKLRINPILKYDNDL